MVNPEDLLRRIINAEARLGATTVEARYPVGRVLFIVSSVFSLKTGTGGAPGSFLRFGIWERIDDGTFIMGGYTIEAWLRTA